MLSPETQPDADDPSPERLPSPPDTAQPVDVVALHNYDHWEGHSVAVTVVTEGGETVLRERHYLPPGRSARLSGAIDPSVYQLRVLVDGIERSRRALRLDGTPDGTPMVELGNGVVSVTGDTASTTSTR